MKSLNCSLLKSQALVILLTALVPSAVTMVAVRVLFDTDTMLSDMVRVPVRMVVPPICQG